ncbi:uncharacterized protein LOC144443116 [Glandiceps talaboti]
MVEVTVMEDRDGSGSGGDVFHPTEPGLYGVWYLIGGWGGLLPTILYSNISHNIASHGFIVTGIDPFIPVNLVNDDDTVNSDDDPVTIQVEDYFDQLAWLEENLNEYLSGISPGVKASWDHVSAGCHSAGCRDIYNMLQQNNTVFKSCVFIEPHHRITEINDFVVPAVMYGTELAYDFPNCNIVGRDYRTFYDHWQCPRVLMQVADYGHCAVLDEEWWIICSNVCTADLTNDHAAYQDYVQGLAHAFMAVYVGGYQPHLDYVINPENIPIALLEHEHDTVC